MKNDGYQSTQWMTALQRIAQTQLEQTDEEFSTPKSTADSEQRSPAVAEVSDVVAKLRPFLHPRDDIVLKSVDRDRSQTCTAHDQSYFQV